MEPRRHDDGTERSRAEIEAERRDLLAQARLRFITEAGADLAAIARAIGLNVHEVLEEARVNNWERDRKEEQQRLIEEIRKRNADAMVDTATEGMKDLVKALRATRQLALDRLQRGLAPDAAPEIEGEDVVVEQRGKDGKVLRATTRKRRLSADAKIVGRVMEIEANVYAAILGAGMGTGKPGASSAEELAVAIQKATERMERATAAEGTDAASGADQN